MSIVCETTNDRISKNVIPRLDRGIQGFFNLNTKYTKNIMLIEFDKGYDNFTGKFIRKSLNAWKLPSWVKGD